ncbi:MAG: hypothetical protein AAF958_19850 [Planctomycetota bacterium]
MRFPILLGCLSWFAIATTMVATTAFAQDSAESSSGPFPTQESGSAPALSTPAPVQKSARELLRFRTRTDQPAADAFARLLDLGRFDDAQAWATRRLRGAEPDSDAAAQAAIDVSECLSRKGQRLGNLRQENLVQILAPVQEMLGQVPTHRRAIFLEDQRLRVRARIVASEIAIAAIRFDSTAVDRVMAAQVQLAGDLQALAERAFRQAGTVPPEMSRDWIRLGRLVLLQRVEMELLAGELFSPGSEDQVRMASVALTAARQAREQIPSDAPAAIELDLLESLAQVRAGQWQNARATLDAALPRIQSPKERARWAAIATQHAIGVGDLDRAKELLGEWEQQPAFSLAIDLARLRYQLASDADATILSQQIGLIGDRHGEYARRVAERLTLGKVAARNRLGTSASPSTMTAELLAAAAQNMIRVGQEKEGAGILISAAKQAPNTSDAVKWATQAAAVLVQTDPAKAADALWEVSTRRSDPLAQRDLLAGLHYQSLHLMQPVAAADELNARLRDHLDRFPGGAHAGDVRTWLLGNLEKGPQTLTKRLDAASYSIDFDAVKRWRRLFRDAGDRGRVTETLLERLAELPKDQAERLAGAATTWLDLSELDRLMELTDAAGGLDETAKQVIALRQADSGSNALTSPSGVNEIAKMKTFADLPWRMIQDAIVDPKRRAAALRFVDPKATNLGPPELAALKLWSGKSDEAKRLLSQWIAAKRGPDRVSQAAAIMATGGAADRRQAAAWHDELARRLPTGSEAWHNAKLAAIGWIAKDDAAQAAKQARYILLTRKSMPAAIRERYLAFAEKASR